MQTPPVTNVTTGKICVSAIALILALTSLAEAAGFNVNSDVTLIPVASSYATSSNTAGCPAGFVGKFSFTAVLTNKPAGAAMPGVTVRVVTLTNGNLLMDPQTAAVLGGQGAEMIVPKTGRYADGLLSPGESVDVPFILCLKTSQPFQFFVDVYGVVTKLVSINLAGTDSGDNQSPFGFGGSPRISADGRWIAFTSSANNLVANDINVAPFGTTDVFVRDVLSEKTSLVSVNLSGTNSGNSFSFGPRISSDARFVAFDSWAADLTLADNQSQQQTYVRDLQTGVTMMASLNRFGVAGGVDESDLDDFSSNGRFVAFESRSDDLVANKPNHDSNLFVRDLQLGKTLMVGVTPTGAVTANPNPDHHANVFWQGSLSADGRYVAFISDATDLVANDANAKTDVFVRDLQLGVTTLVSVNRFGTNSGNNASTSPLISANGRFVMFSSGANDLAPNDTNGVADVFVRDLQTGTTILVSVNRTGTASGNSGGVPNAISADGRFVVFASNSSDLVANDTNGTTPDVFVRDLQTGTTTLVSVNRTGTGTGNAGSGFPPAGSGINGAEISGNGRIVVFNSNATDLVQNHTSTTPGIFVRDLQTGITSLVNVNREGTGDSDTGLFGGKFKVSADGRFVTFESSAGDLVATDSNGNSDVFVRPVP